VTLRRTQPYPFSPVGVSDSMDGTNTIKGGMTALQNLIPFPGTRNLWGCRPASQEIIDFTESGGPFSSGFSSGFQTGLGNPTFISTFKVVGNIVYGLIASDTYPGHDEPFAYNLVTNTLISVTGATLNNTPVSPSDSGDWVPPTMDLIGVRLVVTHPGFNGTAGNYFGWFDITTPGAPVWNAGNTSGAISFSTAPSAVKQFGQRAYFAVNPPSGQPSLVASDVLVATTVTNAGQVLTFGDNQQLTALGVLGLSNQLGGLTQALMVFKGVSNIFQVTGDFALSTGWAVNSLNMATGTLSPLSVCSTPMGLAFVSPEGLRVIDFGAQVSPPIGDAGNGVTSAFIYALSPSRTCAAANANVIRISVQNGGAVGTPIQEYWYHLTRQCWSGPHTFPASMIASFNNTFVMAPSGIDAKLFTSDAAQTSTSTFVENGTQMTFAWQTTMLPDTQQMCENNILEATINMALASGVNIGVSAINQNGTVYQSVVISPTGGQTIWGNFQWGQAQWLGAANGLYPRELQWSEPLVFRRLALLAQGDCASGFLIGDTFLRYEMLGYLQQPAA
jgi:hypothetical protein